MNDPMVNMRKVQSGMHSYADRGLDLNETPECITKALLATGELTGKSIWEPACGRGAISEVLKAHGYNVWSTDIKDYGYGEEHFDFLKWGQYYVDHRYGIHENYETGYDIVTNPPYKDMDLFIDRALVFSKKVVVYLPWSKAEGVHGKASHKGLRERLIDKHLSRVWLGKERPPMLHRDGWQGKKQKFSGAPAGWFVFERHKNHSGFHVERISWRGAS